MKKETMTHVFKNKHISINTLLIATAFAIIISSLISNIFIKNSEHGQQTHCSTNVSYSIKEMLLPEYTRNKFLILEEEKFKYSIIHEQKTNNDLPDNVIIEKIKRENKDTFIDNQEHSKIEYCYDYIDYQNTRYYINNDIGIKNKILNKLYTITTPSDKNAIRFKDKKRGTTDVNDAEFTIRLIQN